MYDLDRKGFIYIKGKVGSFVSFLVSRSDRKTVIFYDTEDEALLIREELEFFSGREVHVFPAYSDKVFEKEDEIRRTGFLSHLASDEAFFGLFPYGAVTHAVSPLHMFQTGRRELKFGDVLFQEDLLAYLDETGV